MIIDKAKLAREKLAPVPLCPPPTWTSLWWLTASCVTAQWLMAVPRHAPYTSNHWAVSITCFAFSVLDCNFKNDGVTVHLCLVFRILAQDTWAWVHLQKSGVGWTCSSHLEVHQPLSQKIISKVSREIFSFYSWLLGIRVFVLIDCVHRWNSCGLVLQKVTNETALRLNFMCHCYVFRWSVWWQWQAIGLWA
jgi:hypothetical protein